MPNHVRNRVVFNGTKEDVAKVFAFINGENGAIDFNSIIPQPMDLDKPVSGNTQETKDKGWMWRLLYGYPSWYEWRLDKWGTKWNAYEINTEGATDNFIEFDTAWAAPHPVIKRLAECFPDVEMIHTWADENTSYNCGERRYQGGTLVCDCQVDEGSKEAYELAFDLRPYIAEYYEFVDGEYRYKEDE